jgi:hypothetical protein
MRATPIYEALDAIDQWDDCDGESIHMCIPDSSGDWTWHWVSIETIAEYGRADILAAFGIGGNEWEDEAA